MSYAKLHNSFVRNQICGFDQSQSARKFEMFLISIWFSFFRHILILYHWSKYKV